MGRDKDEEAFVWLAIQQQEEIARAVCTAFTSAPLTPVNMASRSPSWFVHAFLPAPDPAQGMIFHLSVKMHLVYQWSVMLVRSQSGIWN